MKHICANRPFQISAFFLSPKGPRPSLKFHCLSDNEVVEGVRTTGLVLRVLREFDLGVTNPLTEEKRRAKRARKESFIMIDLLESLLSNLGSGEVSYCSMKLCA